MAKRQKHIKKLDMREFIKKYDCLEIVKDHKFLKKLNLVENTKLRRSLGMACYGRNTIEMSTRILHETDENIRETLIHEMCHFVSYRVFKEAGHGPKFKYLMAKYYHKERKTRFHQGKLTTEYVIENGKRVLKKKQEPQPEEVKIAA